jgi:UDP-N-acetylglucosamine 1-carboxyvinyltransferase
MAIVAGVDFGTLSVRVSIVDSQRGRLGSGVADYVLCRTRQDPNHATQRHADHMEALLQQFEACGVTVQPTAEGLRVRRPAALAAHDLRTSPHPGFPTDMQAQYMTLMTQAKGASLIAETIFERRFMHVGELQRMGADIRIDGRSAVVVGPTRLTGAQVMATDLRASACLVLAGLVADGVTVVDRAYHLDRGYESMEMKLGALGASIERIR